MSQVESGIDRDDIYEIRLHTQRAQTRIMQDFSWTWMQYINQYVQPVNTDFLSLPLDFKEFQRGGRGAVRIIDPIFGYFPIELVVEGRHIKGGYPGYYVAPQLARFRAWVEMGVNATRTDNPLGAPGRLRMFFPTDSAITYEFSYYRYLPIASLDSDTNAMTTQHTEALIHKATALAYETVGDERADVEERAYRYYLDKDKKRDAYINVSAMTLRM